MNATIIYAHPYTESFNGAVLDAACDSLFMQGDSVTVVDLYRDGFNPVMTQEDLRLYSAGESTDPMVARYNDILSRTDKIVLIFPIWWYDMPAILRGFFDKVMLPGITFGEGAAGIYPLRAIAHTRVYTTSAATDEDLIHRFGDPVQGTIIAGTFAMVGFGNAEWHNLGGMSTATQDDREAFLRLVTETV